MQLHALKMLRRVFVAGVAVIAFGGVILAPTPASAWLQAKVCVKANATTAYKRNVVSVVRAPGRAAGVYDVTFNGNIKGCYVQVTLGDCVNQFEGSSIGMVYARRISETQIRVDNHRPVVCSPGATDICFFAVDSSFTAIADCPTDR